MSMNDDNWFETQQKAMIKRMGFLWLIGAALWIGGIFGIIYFVFWCLKHFGII